MAHAGIRTLFVVAALALGAVDALGRNPSRLAAT
jgi:hypothetical protein